MIQFRLVDWIAIVVFTHLFYVGIVSLLFGSFAGGIILFVAWELWGTYERWRIQQ